MTGPRLEHPATPMVWRDLALPDTEPLHILPTIFTAPTEGELLV